MDNFNIVGKRVKRVDGLSKVTGAAEYTDDITLPEMLHGRILRSPYPHARICNIDTSKAKRLPGVKAVMSALDILSITRTLDRYDGYGVKTPDKPRILAEDKVRFVGEEVAAVAAIDEDVAEEALHLIRVEYEELPSVFSPEEALMPGAPLIHDGVEKNIAQQFQFSRGDINRGFSDAKVIVEDRYATQNAHQCYMEPLGCICEFDINGKLTVWCGTMFPSGIRQSLSRVFNISESKIRVLQMEVGGAFGGKIQTRQIFPICALLAKETGRPVKIVYTREEEFSAGRPRESAVIYMKIGARDDGIITAREAKLIYESGAYSFIAPRMQRITSVRSDALYRYTNLKTEGILVYTNKAPVGAYRGYGNPEMTFAVETLLDVLAEKLGIDPMEIRLKNATQTGDTTVHGWNINSCGLSECIKKTAEAVSWKEKRSRKNAATGIGMACMIHIVNPQVPGFTGSTAYAKILEDGKIQVITGEAEYGQGTNTSYCMIAAEEFGIPYEDVEVSRVDTDITPYSLGPFGTRVMMVGGNAVRLAVADAKRQLLELASNELEANIADLEIMNRQVTVKGSPDRAISISDVAKLKILRDGRPITGTGAQEDHLYCMYSQERFDPIGNVASAYYFDALVAEVEVDIRTGKVKVLEIVDAVDCGRVINPIGLEGQVDGGVIQGLGYTLMENLHRGGKHRVLNSGFLDYKVPTALDAPRIRSIFVESVEPSGPFGAKGGGESAGAVSTSAAIANAIYDAVGVRIRELPITAEKVFSELNNNKVKTKMK